MRMITDYFEQEIPSQERVILKRKDLKSVKINQRTENSKEKLVNLKTAGIAGVSYYNLNLNPPYNHKIPGSLPSYSARAQVAEKLKNINKKLKRVGYELFVFDAYRPLEVQNYFYFEWYPKFLKKLFPTKTDLWIQDQVDQYWSAGAKTDRELLENPPTHATGAAVDLSIRNLETGNLLEMGSMFDDLWSVSHLDFFEKRKNEDEISLTDREALKNRRFLYHLMKAEGFAQNPYEWWHFSYGDKAWALMYDEKEAFYPYFKLE